jgi:hypothetical protein
MASACSPRANGADCWLRHVPPASRAAMSVTDDPVRPEARAASRRARGKRLRGAGLLRRNGKTIKAPGEARPPRALPTPPGNRRPRIMPQTSPSPSGGGSTPRSGGGVGRTQHPVHQHSPRRAPPTLLRLRLRTVPLPIRCANREETRPATHPPIVTISRAANPLTSLAFPKVQRHEPSSLRPPP